MDRSASWLGRRSVRPVQTGPFHRSVAGGSIGAPVPVWAPGTRRPFEPDLMLSVRRRPPFWPCGAWARSPWGAGRSREPRRNPRRPAHGTPNRPISQGGPTTRT